MRGYQDRVCERCGAVFRGTVRARFCSAKCRVYAARERRDAIVSEDFIGHRISVKGQSATVRSNREVTLPDVEHVPAGEE